MAKKATRVRKNFLFPADLAAWVERYAQGKNTTVTQIIVDHLTGLRKQEETGYADQI